ncbi:MAG: NAD(P)/FAD-dependent oxidoreductase [Woeseiaceae bacterium]
MPPDEVRNVTIIGAGQAGSHAAQSLRKRGYDGAITILGNEGHLPYQRPPLSKAFLKGEMDEARLSFKPDSYYRDHDIRLILSAVAESIDTDQHLVNCGDGQVVPYDRLIVATGSTPMQIPCQGAALEGVLALRGLDDSKAIRASLEHSNDLVVIGGGYIGLEVASAARQLGHTVTIVERMPRLLSRVTSPPISDFYLDLHRERGVDIRLEDSVSEITGDARVTAVRLESGEEIPADTVLIGIGVRPNQGIAEAAGISCDDGILVDENCRTSDKFVYAAGDCARSVMPDKTTVRLESVHNALDQAERIAADIVGDARPAYDPPWFWSDQYDIKLQTIGLFNDYTDIMIRGDVGAKKFSALYFREDALIAIDAVNDPVSFMTGKQVFKKGITITREQAGAPDVSLKEIYSMVLKKETTQ